MAKNITARTKDYSEWYQDVIKAAELADYSPVRGCMVIRPNGYALWEGIQRDLDTRFKATGHVNAYFPVLIPVSFLQKEAEHVEGFAMECAVVTHSGLEKGPDGLRATSPLSEPLIIRPTSETLFGHMYAQWIQSYRDLPLLINQWANVMRWEMRTRLFLRTSEFLWQEGHTAHETEKEAQEETLRMLEVYRAFAEEYLAIPVIKGRKTASEKFPGAVTTYCIEALMQDRRALQAGTSHNLGQNFAKAFDMQFSGRDNQLHHCWTTSWGVSTRLIGAAIMVHSDDEGLILPPRLAPTLIAVVPIFKSAEEKEKVLAYCRDLIGRVCGADRLAEGERNSAGREFLSVFTSPQALQKVVLDMRDERPAEKHFYWEQRGVPFRLEVGPRDIDKNAFVWKERWDASKSFHEAGVLSEQWLQDKMHVVQAHMLDKARKFRDANTIDVATLGELKEALLARQGFVRCWFAENAEAEAKIKEETKGTVRVIPFDQSGHGPCIYSGQDVSEQALFSVAY
ncbi:MAG TPA: proline--tRNA ligase [Candidatus Xenobia bacterium]|jgi:prolyl-tRNA synthetase